MRVELLSVPGVPRVQPGDDVGAVVAEACAGAGLELADGDVVVVASKIVSKAEGRLVDLRSVTPGAEAEAVAARTEKDPRLVELILAESTGISRERPGTLLVRHRLGFTSANAGIDRSNVAGDDEVALLLPLDPDASARALRAELERRTGRRLAVVITDTHGRPFRLGNLGAAIGVAGMPALLDERGRHDLDGRELHVTLVPLADAIAAAADLVSGQADEGRPVTVLRGLPLPPGDGAARDLVRPLDQDLYR